MTRVAHGTTLGLLTSRGDLARSVVLCCTLVWEKVNPKLFKEIKKTLKLEEKALKIVCFLGMTGAH